MSALTTTGLISIDEMDITYDKARTSAFQGLCDCTQSSDFLSIQGTERATLLNIKSATRTTLATATVGSTLLSLPQTDLERICGVETAESMEILRDYVAHVSEKFMRALDTMINPQVSTALLKTKHGVEFTSIQSIVQAATNLEHFHVYSKPGDKENEDEDTSLLPLHTDAGLFLTFVPGMSCHGGEENIGHFYIESPISKQQERAVFAPNTIGIMLGHGAQHWLHYSSGIQLRATRHAVKLNKGESRAWFGKMHLVPQHALVKKNTTFADLQRNMRSDHGDVSIGCGSRQIKEHDTLLPTTITRKRRLQHITNGSSCNNVTNHFCWMTCQVRRCFEHADTVVACSRLLSLTCRHFHAIATHTIILHIPPVNLLSCNHVYRTFLTLTRLKNIFNKESPSIVWNLPYWHRPIKYPVLSTLVLNAMSLVEP